MIQFRGIEFRGVDNRLMALKLVQLGLSGVAMFGPDREVLQPSEVLRKKAILVERGSFRPPTHVNLDMLETAGPGSRKIRPCGKPVLERSPRSRCATCSRAEPPMWTGAISSPARSCSRRAA
jgi:hypothetical protein